MSDDIQDFDEVEEPTVPVFEKTPRTKPQFMVVGETFVAQTADGELKVPLRFKTKLFRKILKSDGDEVEMFLDLIEGMGDTDTIEALDELDIFESAKLAAAYFRGWKEKQQASPGEQQRSSRS